MQKYVITCFEKESVCTGVSLPTLTQNKSCLLQLDQPVFYALLPSPYIINELGCTMRSMVLCQLYLSGGPERQKEALLRAIRINYAQ